MKTLLILGAALAPFAVAMAADDAAKPKNLAPVIVTGTRSAEPENRLPAEVVVITREDIERSGASSVADALRSSGVAQITDFYGSSSPYKQVDVRGLGDTASSNTLVLVDGRRLNNPDIAAPDLNSIALKDVERIEVIRGSAATLYGDQAVGGVINIITRSIQKTTASLEASAGSYSNFGTRAQGGQRLGNFAYRLSAEERGSKNYRDHNASEFRNFFGYTEYSFGADTRVFAEAAYADEDLQAPGALFANEVRQNRRQVSANYRADFADSRTRNFRVGSDIGLTKNWQLQMEGSHRQSSGVFRLSSTFAPATSNATQNREINAITPRVIGKIDLPTGQAQLTAGLDAQKARYALRSSVGPQLNDQDLTDGYAQIIVPLPAKLEATLGGRVARVQNQGVNIAFGAGGPFDFGDTQYASETGLAWRPVQQARLYLRQEKNFRFAKVDEFTNTAFGAAPCKTNQPLCTQTGRSYEVGGEWTEKRWNVGVSFFRLDLDNEIVFDNVAFANVNLPSTRRDGQTLRMGWQALEMLKLGATYQHLDAQVRSGTFTGREVPMVASQIGTLAADLSLPLQLVLHTEVLATRNRVFGGDFNNNLNKLGGYATTNVALSRNTGTWQFTARVNNLLDAEYSEYGAAGGFPAAGTYFPSPGINGLLTIRYVY